MKDVFGREKIGRALLGIIQSEHELLFTIGNQYDKTLWNLSMLNKLPETFEVEYDSCYGLRRISICAFGIDRTVPIFLALCANEELEGAPLRCNDMFSGEPHFVRQLSIGVARGRIKTVEQ